VVSLSAGSAAVCYHDVGVPRELSTSQTVSGAEWSVFTLLSVCGARGNAA